LNDPFLLSDYRFSRPFPSSFFFLNSKPRLSIALSIAKRDLEKETVASTRLRHYSTTFFSHRMTIVSPFPLNDFFPLNDHFQLNDYRFSRPFPSSFFFLNSKPRLSIALSIAERDLEKETVASTRLRHYSTTFFSRPLSSSQLRPLVSLSSL
jgi:hypothetical protein